MAESTSLAELIQLRIDEFLADRTSILASVGADLAPVSEFSREFLSGGKRFRAQFCWWGWQSVRTEGTANDEAEAARALRCIVSAASALELFHAAALVHDDIIDKSDTRRGAPSAHRRFEDLHRAAGYAGEAADYGRSAALLLGDLLLGFSDELFDDALADLDDTGVARAARREFNRMRLEVTAGQYLDILEENAWKVHPEEQQLSRAERVVTYKSAKYSVEAPLVIGATLAGGTPDQIDALRAFGLPLGVAYQLRDDLLGVFGDSAVTGKPSGDDLREGKRTILIAHARQALPTGSRHVLDDLLGDPALDADQVRMLQRTIADSGAVDRVEELIDENVASARAAIDDAPLTDSAREHLGRLTTTVTRRTF